MIIETIKGNFELIKNTKESFNKEQFESKYIDDIFNKYEYIVGDVSSEILRLKGFDGNPNSARSYKTIPDYLAESCQFNCGYYILKRYRPKKEEPVVEAVVEETVVNVDLKEQE